MNTKQVRGNQNSGDARKRILQSGSLQCARSMRERFDYPRHLHLAMEVLLIIEGSAYLETPNGAAFLNAGDLALLWPDEPHSGFALGSEGASFLSLMAPFDTFEKNGLRMSAGLAGSLASRILSRCMTQAEHRTLLEADDAPRLLAVAEFVLQLVGRGLKPDPTPCSSGWHEKTGLLLRDSPQADMSSSRLAATYGLNASYAATSFKARFGLSPRDLTVARKVERAREAMLSTKSLVDIAFMCGFADQAHLSRCFRRVYGLPPAAFRRRNECVGGT